MDRAKFYRWVCDISARAPLVLSECDANDPRVGNHDYRIPLASLQTGHPSTPAIRHGLRALASARTIAPHVFGPLVELVSRHCIPGLAFPRSEVHLHQV